MTPEDEENFKNSTSCHICRKEYSVSKDRIKDFNPKTLKYVGACHNNCKQYNEPL